MTPFAVGVVLYHPSSEVLDTILYYAKTANQVYLINNSSAEDIDHLRVVLESKNVKLIQNLDNLGIARALNQVIELSREDNFSYLFLFDQDSQPVEKMLNTMMETADQNSSVGIFVPTHIDYTGNIIKVDHEVSKQIVSITSGMLLNLRILPLDLIHDEKLFIDYVDIDFFLKAIKKRIEIRKVSYAKLTHALGNPKSFQIGKLKILSTNHNAKRRYYIARNRTLIIKRYFIAYPQWSIRQLRRYFTEILTIIVFDNDKIIKIRNYLIGIIHGFLGIDGKVFK